MQDGDLSNEIAPRLWWMWEGLVADLPRENQRAEWFYRKAKRWHRAVDQWARNELIVAHIWDLAVRHDFSSDIFTCREAGFASALRDRLDDLPCRVMHFSTPGAAARATNNPSVARVFFGYPELAFTFGSVGRLVREGGRGFSPLT